MLLYEALSNDSWEHLSGGENIACEVPQLVIGEREAEMWKSCTFYRNVFSEHLCSFT